MLRYFESWKLCSLVGGIIFRTATRYTAQKTITSNKTSGVVLLRKASPDQSKLFSVLVNC
jgi:hypothetical protein